MQAEINAATYLVPPVQGVAAAAAPSDAQNVGTTPGTTPPTTTASANHRSLPMNAVTTTWRQLVRNKLWPVALLLLAALVAVPVLLAREPAVPEPLAPLPVTTEADDTIAEPIVAKVTAEDRDRRRRVLGVRKDPFRAGAGQEDQGRPSSPTTPEAGRPATAPAPAAPAAAAAASPPRLAEAYYEPGTIVVRFGEATSDASSSASRSRSSAPCPTTSSRCSSTWA